VIAQFYLLNAHYFTHQSFTLAYSAGS